MSSHKRVSFSSVLIYLLADNIPRFFRTLTPFPSTWPCCFSLGQSLASPGFESNLRKERKQEKMTQGSFQVRCPGFHYFVIFKVRDRAIAPHQALGPLTASWSVLRMPFSAWWWSDTTKAVLWGRPRAQSHVATDEVGSSIIPVSQTAKQRAEPALLTST